MENLIKVATGELGVTEITGSIDNDRILQYANETGQLWIDDMKPPGAVFS